MATKQSMAAFAAKMAAKYGEDKVSNDPAPVIVPTGVLSLDVALRVGGWQLGRIYELVGPKDSCKSWLGIQAMVQHRLAFPGLGVAYVNLEKTFERPWATVNGLVCTDAARKAGLWQPYNANTSEEASDMARDALASGTLSCLVLDSVGAMESNRVLTKEADKGADDSRRNAGIITKLTKALAGLAHDNQVTVLLINQPRANQTGFGGDVSAGPKAMQHSTTAQLKMSARGAEGDTRTGKYLGNQITVGRRFRAQIPRMKNGAPGRQAEWWVMTEPTERFGGVGLDQADDVVTVGVQSRAIEQQNGGYYLLPSGQRIRGRDEVGAFLRTDPEAMAAVRAALKFDAPIVDPLEETA